MACKLKLASVLLHKFFEAAKGHDFPQRSMDSVCPRFDAENLYGFVSKLRV
jgi:hypothetical protein